MNFNPILTLLNGIEFVSRDFSESITFNNANFDGDDGFIYNKNKDLEKYRYRVEKINEKIYIDSAYFSGRYQLELLPTGFNLRAEDGSLIKEYVSIFCIENQKIFIAILEFLKNKNQAGLYFTIENIVKEIPEVFPQEMAWDERCEVSETVIEILITNNSVTKGMHHGELAIDVHRNTAFHLPEQKYIWKK
jgi:hypothetical protein